jgi:hypothetical protein
MIRTATEEDAAYIGARLRRADWEELWAATGESPRMTTIRSFEISDESWVLDCGGAPLAIWGIGTSYANNCGVPWMVGTNHMEKHKRDIMGISRVMLDYYHTRHHVLINFTDARHTDSHRYLKWLGFEFLPAVPHGHAGLPFHQFMRVADV